MSDLSAPTKVVVFALGLAVVFAASLGVGTAVGSVADEPVTHDEEHVTDGPDQADADEPTTTDIPGGLMVSQDGYTFRLADGRVRPGDKVPIAFAIEGPDGRPVTDYDVEHEKRLHLIAVRRDMTGFQHVHPELDGEGVWTTGLDLTAGQWRLFADFTATGADGLTLGADLSVAGDYDPVPEPGETRTARVGDYEVTLEGDLTPGSDARLTLTVTRDGREVTDLEPYLGAYGHLVALREGDLAYLHVHPDGAPGDGRTDPGPEVVFYAAVPSSGGYRLYLDFKHDGVVRTAAFAVSAGEDASHGEEADDDHGH